MPAADTVAICVATFYAELADRLVAGARGELERAGLGSEDVDLYEVPGAFDLPPAARYCAEDGRYAGVICLGAVIRGETAHFDFVCAEAARGIQTVQLETGVPSCFGVLTVDTMEQAVARTGGGRRDQGVDAARAVLALIAIRRELARTRPADGGGGDRLP